MSAATTKAGWLLLLIFAVFACSSCNVTRIADQAPPAVAESANPQAQTVAVRDFGATCNGVSNDSIPIQRAIDTANQQGGIVEFTGLCGVGSGGIQITGNDVTLHGVNPDSGVIVLAPGPNKGIYGSTSIVFTNCARCGLNAIRLEGNGINSNLVGFENTSFAGVSNSVLHASGNLGAIVADANTGNHYSQNEITNGTGVSRGMWIGNTMDGTLEVNAYIADNVVSHMPATGIVCTCTNSTILRNESSYNAGSGIIFPASVTSASHVTASQNLVLFNKFSGFQSDAMPGSYSEFITLTDNVSKGNATSGIYVVRARNWVVNNNHVMDNLFHGIEVGEARDVSIDSNVVEDTRIDSERTQDVGINVMACASIPDEVQDVTVKNNTSRNNITNGIFVVNCAFSTMSRVTLTGNTSSENGAYGIRASATSLGAITSLTISSNVLTGNRWPIRIDFIDGNFENNHW